jgi:hypothetical protein
MLLKQTHLQRDRLVQYKASIQSKQSGSLEEYFRTKLDWQEIAIKEVESAIRDTQGGNPRSGSALEAHG